MDWLPLCCRISVGLRESLVSPGAQHAGHHPDSPRELPCSLKTHCLQPGLSCRPCSRPPARVQAGSRERGAWSWACRAPWGRRGAVWHTGPLVLCGEGYGEVIARWLQVAEDHVQTTVGSCSPGAPHTHKAAPTPPGAAASCFLTHCASSTLYRDSLTSGWR